MVVPTLLLGFYGLSGLKNARDAEESRLRDRYSLQARALEQGVIARIAEEDVRVRTTLATVKTEDVPAALAVLSGGPGLVDEAWLAEDPTLPDVVRGEDTGPEGEGGTASDPPLTFRSVDDGHRVSTYARSRIRPGLTVVYRIDPAAIDAVVIPEIVGRLFPTEAARYHLVHALPAASGEQATLDRLRRDLAERVLAAEPEVDRAMSPPFVYWRITIAATGDPTGRSSGGTITLVLVLVAMTVSGVTLMGRAVVQQARLSRLQTDFVSNVSHELRTPLTSIRLFVETLQSGRVKDPEKVAECLEIIGAESERLSKKIERVLSWARLEAGRRAYDMELRHPRDVVARVLTAFQTQQLVAGNPVQVDVPDDLPLIRVDMEAMEEALLNLLSNARKYGGDDVHIRVRAWADRRYVSIAVIDDGPGIPRAERKRIFEKFYRPDLLQTRRNEGSGLGLAIVRAVVQAHKGRVDVESEAGHGARFTIRLKRAG